MALCLTVYSAFESPRMVEWAGQNSAKRGSANAAAVVKHRVLTLLNAIAARCLDKNSDIRFQSMEEVIMFLKQGCVS